jgi:hypothetical protein
VMAASAATIRMVISSGFLTEGKGKESVAVQGIPLRGMVNKKARKQIFRSLQGFDKERQPRHSAGQAHSPAFYRSTIRTIVRWASPPARILVVCGNKKASYFYEA